MAQLHAHPWHTHPDVSPFVPPSMTAKLLAGGMKFAGLSTQTAADTASTVRQPESMQVDSSGAHAGASHASSSAAAASHQSAAAASQRSQAGPSGAATAGTSYDAQMSDVSQRKPARKHSEAPMRKLSVHLIDTYKLINQVRASLSQNGYPASALVHLSCGEVAAVAAATGVTGGARWCGDHGRVTRCAGTRGAACA